MKSYKKLLPFALILVVLIIATILIFALKPKEEKGPAADDLTIYKVDAANVKELTVKRKGLEDLVIDNKGIDSEGNATWGLGGKDGGFSQEALGRFMLVLTDYKATQKLDLENPDLTEYGLNDPQYRVIIDSSEGLKTIAIGNDTPDGQSVYCMVEGTNVVYTVAAMKKTYCGYDAIDFYETVKLGVDFSNVVEASFERKNQKADKDNFKIVADVSFSNGSPVFDIREPYEISAGTSLSELMTKIGGLELSRFTDLSDEDKKKFGIDDPSYIFKFTTKNGKEIVLNLTKSFDDIYYGTSNVTDEIFMISPQQISSSQIAYLDLALEQYLSSNVFYFKVTDIRHIVCRFDDKEFTFKIDTKDSISSDDAQVYLDGRDASVVSSSDRSYAAILFEALSCIQVGEVSPEPESIPDKPDLTFTVVDKSVKETTLSFYKRSDASYYCYKNGKYTGFVVYADELYKDGGANTYDYGIVAAYNLLTTAINDNLNGVYDLP